jgi:phage gp29-like protein
MKESILKKVQHLLKIFVTRKKMGVNVHGYLPDPDKILAENGYDYEILRDLTRDGHLSAAITQRKMQVLQMGWEITYDNEEIKKEAIDITRSLDLQKIASQLLDCILYGYEVAEIEYQLLNGKITPVELEEKPQEWFIYDNENELRLRARAGSRSGAGFYYIFEEGEKLPEYKFIITRNNPKYINPYGEKLLSKCYWPVIFKRAAIEYWQIMAEKFGIPYFLARYPSTFSDDQIDELVEKLTEITENNVAAFRDDIPIEFKESVKYEVGGLFSNIITHYNSEISKVILTETLTLDIGKVGSYKAAETHREMLEFMGVRDKKLIEKSINTLFDYYVKINYGLDIGPRIKLTKKESVIEETVQRDKTLYDMGIRFTEEYYKKRYNLTDNDFKKIEN